MASNIDSKEGWDVQRGLYQIINSEELEYNSLKLIKQA